MSSQELFLPYLPKVGRVSLSFTSFRQSSLYICFTYLSHSESRGSAGSITSIVVTPNTVATNKIENVISIRPSRAQPPKRCTRIVHFYSFRIIICCYSFIFIIIKLSCYISSCIFTYCIRCSLCKYFSSS